MALWAQAYAGREIQPRNSLLDASGAPMTPDPAWYAARQRGVIAAMEAGGMI
jgi:hypothetical protein